MLEKETITYIAELFLMYVELVLSDVQLVKLKKNNVFNRKYEDMMKVFWSNCKSEDIIKILFLSERHSKPDLELKYYEKSCRNPKTLGENISSSSNITLNDGNHRSSLSKMFYEKCFLKNLAIQTGKHCTGVSF